MKLFVGHASALECWRAEDASNRSKLPRARLLRLPAGQRPGIQEIELLHRQGLVLSTPTHVLVADAGMRSRNQYVVCHVHPGEFPRGSFVRLSEQVFIASPEYTLLQLATKVPYPRLLELVLEFCGSYRRLPEGGFCKRDPLIRPAILKSFTDRAEGMSGVVEMRRALRFAVAGSESPMETVVVILLCLPLRLGGYGLPLPQLNRVVGVPMRPGSPVMKDLRCDLLWPDARLAVEYDSNEQHTGAERISHDAGRRARLAERDIEVVTLTWKQVNNLVEFDVVAKLLAKRLGKRFRGDRSWMAERFKLRALLLDASKW